MMWSFEKNNMRLYYQTKKYQGAKVVRTHLLKYYRVSNLEDTLAQMNAEEKAQTSIEC